jgi:hypothetical protein
MSYLAAVALSPVLVIGLPMGMDTVAMPPLTVVSTMNSCALISDLEGF